MSRSSSKNPSSPLKGYKIIEVIGSGGMATLYKATQETLNRTVAIKELSIRCAQDAALVERFSREAKVAATLSHENIVHIYDYAQRGKSHCIVMEYVNGIDLAQILTLLMKLPTNIALIIAYEVSRALVHAHSRGLIHRDIKPGNIMLTNRGEVKLMDFGIAQIPNLKSLTLPGTFLGTPSYMSPEQSLGEKVGPPSDQFSLGVVFYELLTGTKPFFEDDEKTIFERIRSCDFLPPRKLNPNIPRGVERIILKCLQPSPRARYAHTQEFNQRLFQQLRKRVQGDPRKTLRKYLMENELVTAGASDTEEFFKDYLPAEPAQLSIEVLGDGSLFQWNIQNVSVACYRWVRNSCIVLCSAFLLAFVHNPKFPRLGIENTMDQKLLKSQLHFSTLQVHVNPWATVYLDDRLIALTPTAEKFYVRSGRHTVRFTSPYLKEKTLSIFLEKGENKKVHVDLEK